MNDPHSEYKRKVQNMKTEKRLENLENLIGLAPYPPGLKMGAYFKLNNNNVLVTPVTGLQNMIEDHERRLQALEEVIRRSQAQTQAEGRTRPTVGTPNLVPFVGTPRYVNQKRVKGKNRTKQKSRKANQTRRHKSRR